MNQCKMYEQQFDKIIDEMDTVLHAQFAMNDYASEKSQRERNEFAKRIDSLINEIKANGFVAKFHHRRGTGRAFITVIKESKSFECGLNKVMFDDVKREDGDCTIRANSWLTKVDYTTMLEEQKKWCMKKYHSFSAKHRWNDWGVWYMPLVSRGYKILKLNKRMQANTIVQKLKNIKYQPFCAVSNNHAVAIDSGSVVDCWDSRHKVVRTIVVKPEDVKNMIKVLNCQDFTDTTLKRDFAPVY